MQTRNSDPAAWTRFRGAPPLPLAWSGGVPLLALVHHLCLSLWRLPSRVVGAAACREPSPHQPAAPPGDCPCHAVHMPAGTKEAMPYTLLVPPSPPGLTMKGVPYSVSI